MVIFGDISNHIADIAVNFANISTAYIGDITMLWYFREVVISREWRRACFRATGLAEKLGIDSRDPIDFESTTLGSHMCSWKNGNSHLQMIFPHKKSPVYFGYVASHTPGPSLYRGTFMMVKSLFMDEPSSNQTWQTGTSASSMNLRTEPPFRERGISS